MIYCANDGGTGDRKQDKTGAADGKSATAGDKAATRDEKSATACENAGSADGKSVIAGDNAGPSHGKSATASDNEGTADGKRATAGDKAGTGDGKSATNIMHDTASWEIGGSGRLDRSHAKRGKSNARDYEDLARVIEDSATAVISSAIVDYSDVRGENSRARGESSCARAENSSARAENSSARAENSRARAENSCARAENSWARAENSWARAENSGARAEEYRAGDDNNSRVVAIVGSATAEVICVTDRAFRLQANKAGNSADYLIFNAGNRSGSALDSESIVSASAVTVVSVLDAAATARSLKPGKHTSTAHIHIDPSPAPAQNGHSSQAAEERVTRAKQSVVRGGAEGAKEIPVPPEIFQILESGLVSLPGFNEEVNTTPNGSSRSSASAKESAAILQTLSDVSNKSCDSRVPYLQKENKSEEKKSSSSSPVHEKETNIRKVFASHLSKNYYCQASFAWL